MSRAWGLVARDKSYDNFLTQQINVTQKRTVSRQAVSYQTITDELALGNLVTQKASDASPNSAYTVMWPPSAATNVSDVLGVAAIDQQTIQLDWQVNGSGNDPPVPSQFVQVSPEFTTPLLGKRYATLTDAVNYVSGQSPSPTNRWTIQIYPGIYTEPDTVVIPSYVTVNGDFGLTVVITTSGSSHILHASNRCDIYNLVVQGPTAAGKAGIFADDVDIGFFMGNVRFVNCDYGLLLQPALNKIVFAYVRNCLFNSNLTHQIFVNGNVKAFLWNNVLFAPSVTPDTYGPLLKIQGAGAEVQGYGNDFEREAALVTGIAVQLQDEALYSSASATYNWFATAIDVVLDHSNTKLYLNGPRFLDCDINLNMANPETIGYLLGANEFTKNVIVYPTAFFVNSSLPTTITVGTNGASDFTDLVAAVAYVTAQNPAGDKRFVINLSAGNYFVNQTLTIPDFCDLVGDSFTQTSITMTALNTDMIHAGYESRITDLTLWGYGTDPDNPNFVTPTANSAGYGIRYMGSSSFSRIGYVENVQFGNLYYAIGITTQPALYNVIQLQTVRFRGYVNTHTCIAIDAGLGAATAVGLRNSRFSPTFVNLLPGAFTAFLSMTANAPDVINNLTADTINIVAGGTDDNTPSGNPLKYGIGFEVVQGNLSLQNTRITQMASAFHVPAGTSPVVAISSTTVTTCTRGLWVESATATGSFQGIMDRLLVDSVSPLLGLLLTEPDGQGSVIVGGIYQVPTSLIEQGTINVPTNLSPQLNQGGTVGVLTGGVLSVSGSNVLCSAGSGYVMVGVVPNDVLHLVTFDAQSTALTADQNNYVYIDVNGTLLTAISNPNPLNFLLLGTIVMNGSSVLYIDQGTDVVGSEANMRHLASNINLALQNQFGAIVVSGLIFTNTGLQLAMTQGQYYVGSVSYVPSAITAGSTFIGLYNGGSGTIGGSWTAVTNLTQTPLQWNDNGVLTTLVAGEFAKHSLYISCDNSNQKLFLIYGTETFASANDADAGPLPTPPTFFSANVLLCAAVVISDTAIVHILDQRPTLVSRTGSIVATNNHSNLINLAADDHLQYFRTDGTRLMTGAIDTNNNNIVVGTGTVDGVIVHAHASRHVPGGADSLPTASAVTITALTNSEGVAGTFARSDHQHAHGAQTEPTLHAVATSLANGFMSATDKSFLDDATALDSINTLVERNNNGTFECRGVALYDTGGSAGVTLTASSGSTPYTLTFPATDGTNNQVLTTDGTGITTWTSITPAIFSGVLPIANGGTNSSTALSNNRIIVSSGGALVEAPALSNGQLLIGATSGAPSNANLTAGTGISISNAANAITINNTGVTSITAGAGLTGGIITTTGTIALAAPVTIAHGGTNSTTALAGNRIMGSSATSIVERAAMTNGQLIIGNSGNAPSNATLTAGSGINITNGAGTITIAATGATNTDRVFAYSTVTQSVNNANTFQDVTFSNNGILSGWTHVAGSASFVCATSGDYLVTVHGNGTVTAGAPKIIEMVLLNNGAQVAGSQLINSLQTNNAIQTVSGSCLVSMVATQTLTLQLTGTNGNVQLVAGSGIATVKPSVSITITPIN